MQKTKNKLRLLYLQKILVREASEEYPLTVEMLCQKLADVGIAAHRKTIYEDMKLLEAFGLDVICEQRQQNQANHYYVGEQHFQLPELKALIDAVQFARFLTPKKSQELLTKLCELTNCHDAKRIANRFVVDDVFKQQNEQIYLNLHTIFEALCEQRQLKFQYLTFNARRQLVPKRNGEWYEVTPYGLTPYDHKYYLIAYHERYDQLVHFRVDLMQAVKMSEQASQRVTEQRQFKLAEYCQSSFSMMSGPLTSVELCWEQKLRNVVFDRFGQSVHIIGETATHVTIRVEVQVSAAFYAWLFKFGQAVQIVAPQTVRNAFHAQLLETLNSYQVPDVT